MIYENIKDKFLYKIPEECKKFDAIICEPIGVSGVKFMKIFKNGFKNFLAISQAPLYFAWKFWM